MKYWTKSEEKRKKVKKSLQKHNFHKGSFGFLENAISIWYHTTCARLQFSALVLCVSSKKTGLVNTVVGAGVLKD